MSLRKPKPDFSATAHLLQLQAELDGEWERIQLLEEEVKLAKSTLAQKAAEYKTQDVYSKYFSVSTTTTVNQAKAKEVLMQNGFDPSDYYYEIVQQRFNIKKVKQVLGTDCPTDQTLTLRRKMK